MKNIYTLCDEENLCNQKTCYHYKCMNELFLVPLKQYYGYNVGFMPLLTFGKHYLPKKYEDQCDSEFIKQMAMNKVPYIQLPDALVREVKTGDSIKDSENYKDYIARSRACMFCERKGKYVRLKRNTVHGNEIYCPYNRKHQFQINFAIGYVYCYDGRKQFRINMSNRELECFDNSLGWKFLGCVPVIDMKHVKSKLGLMTFS